MKHDNSNIHHFKLGEHIEQTTMHGTTLSLLASSSGTEVIHHTLEDGAKWVIGPTEGWNALEFIYVLSGELLWQQENGHTLIRSGEYLTMAPIKEDAFFTAKGTVTFLYVSSQPVYHHYSASVQHLMKLAVTVEEKDGYTADHCQRIMKLSMMVGEAMGLSTKELYQLNLGSFLHDVGKIRIPDHVLNKPSSLTDEEYELVKKHTIHGGVLLRETNLPILNEVAYIVEQHHERYNGSGYPFGLKGEEIPVPSAIVAVVDSYDAMTSVRVYSNGRSKEEALAEIKRERGRLFNPDVVDAFLLQSHKI